MCAWEVGDCRQELVALSRVGERRRERRKLGFPSLIPCWKGENGLLKLIPRAPIQITLLIMRDNKQSWH
jgi:hypothetical protein